MRWHFVATKNLEPWDWRTPDLTGIGNSETNMIEVAGRLALRGHAVTCYNWHPADAPPDPRGVDYRTLGEADWAEPGIWVLYRCPDLIDRFAPSPEQTIWLMMQDTHYDAATPARAGKLDRVLVLCKAQRAFIAARFPELAEKLVVTSNGLRMEMIRAVEAEVGPVAREPYRLHFSSSPDRGLRCLARIFLRAKEYLPELELHVYYGTNNIEVLMGRDEDSRRYFAPAVRDIAWVRAQPGVVWHGRLGQRALTAEFLKASAWVFPSMYPETSCATSMEAQALGVIPICSPLWALGDNVGHGLIIDGNPYDDPLVRARYARSLVALLTDRRMQDATRAAMMPWARAKFDLDRVVDQWEALVAEKGAGTCALRSSTAIASTTSMGRSPG